MVDSAQEFAYELDDLLLRALLPLFTLREMVGQFEEFTTLRTEIVKNETYYVDGGRAFRDVKGICTDNEILNLYWKAAESIVKDSRMRDSLLNVQLQPGEFFVC